MVKRLLIVGVLTGLVAACNAGANLRDVPVGSHVQIVTHDRVVMAGRLVSVTDAAVTLICDGNRLRAVGRTEIAGVALQREATTGRRGASPAGFARVQD